MDKTLMVDYDPETEEWIVHERDLDDPDKPPINHGSFRSEDEARQVLEQLKKARE
ncbi:MAG: hypothetical protein GWO16_13515 [Gammaproteobacteria bacterium]|nr:hypothetical protein [Gammaproteobacteria bacterium]NIR31787.1 hypothetical protein [Gammaproteobacteria bacterium]NIR98718.1 hypothetical protein [Gammaproteobacteria bacterium]NIT64435.1 hypothetical protein [Gammaproteobacteria bacterium]NIV20850.1 hypothetical protein [Gammaproteobacteria bacterium]